MSLDFKINNYFSLHSLCKYYIIFFNLVNVFVIFHFLSFKILSNKEKKIYPKITDTRLKIKWAYATENLTLFIKNKFSIYVICLINGGKIIIKINTPRILKIKFRFIIVFVLFCVLMVAKYPVIVFPMFATNIIKIEEFKLINELKYICSTIPINPDEDWMMAVENIPNKIDKVLDVCILLIILYIKELFIILSKPIFNISNPNNIKPIYIIRIEYFLYLLNRKYINIPNPNIYKKILDILIAIINVVKHVPKLAPIIIPKHSLCLINLEDNKVIAIAVTPDDDWIKADAIHPIKKLLNFVLTVFWI